MSVEDTDPTMRTSDADAGPSNPWSEPEHAAGPPPKTPDPSALVRELGSLALAPEHNANNDSIPTSRTSEEVLSEFDPLADVKEAGARRAWEGAEGHPMTPGVVEEPASAGPSAPAQPQTSANAGPPVTSASLPGVGFPSLASLARSFSIPKVRTRSVDVALPASILTPNTISAFGQQQQRPSTAADRNSENPDEGQNDGSARPDSRPASPRPGQERGKQRNEPAPFDFQLFLDQMKAKSAEPVAKYLRSFLSNFAKKSFPINEQIRVINEFLNFIALRMREAEVWRNATDVEFDNAMEAMEKLVMNRLYEFTFTPQLAEADPPRPITTDDLERDRVLAQRIALFGWIEEKHLEVPEGPDSRGFLMFAQQELLKINHYKAPRDKLICVLNCCKVIFGLIRHLHKEENADSFVPILIFVVLKANPPNMISNMEYIQRFRNPQKLQSESGYYLSSLMGAVQFIETMDHTGLSNITAEEFERNVEDAIHDLPTSPNPMEKSSLPTSASSSRPSTPSSLSIPTTPARPGGAPLRASSSSPHAGEESAQPLALSLGGVGTGFADDTRRFLQRTGDALGKPLNVLGRILGEALDGFDSAAGGPPGAGSTRMHREGYGSGVPHTPASGTGSGLRAGEDAPPIVTPYKPRVRQLPLGGYPSSVTQGTPISGLSGRSTPESGLATGTPSRSAPGTYPVRGGELGLGIGSSIPGHVGAAGMGAGVSRTPTPALDIAGLQAEIDVAHERAASATLGTLRQIFPGMDEEVIEWVLEAEGGDLGRSIEKLLEVGGG